MTDVADFPVSLDLYSHNLSETLALLQQLRAPATLK